RHAPARQALEKAVQLRPDATEERLALVEVLLALRAADRAEAVARHLVESRPDATAHTALGRALLALDRHGDAERSFRAALRLQRTPVHRVVRDGPKAGRGPDPGAPLQCRLLRRAGGGRRRPRRDPAGFRGANSVAAAGAELAARRPEGPGRIRCRPAGGY